MVYRGTVKEGVVQFDGGITPPADGTPVRVETIEDLRAGYQPDSDPLFRMEELAVDTGIPDLACRLDEYLYGTDNRNPE